MDSQYLLQVLPWFTNTVWFDGLKWTQMEHRSLEVAFALLLIEMNESQEINLIAYVEILLKVTKLQPRERACGWSWMHHFAENKAKLSCDASGWSASKCHFRESNHPPPPLPSYSPLFREGVCEEKAPRIFAPLSISIACWQDKEHFQHMWALWRLEIESWDVRGVTFPASVKEKLDRYRGREGKITKCGW